MNRKSLIAAAIVCFTLGACGGSDGSPTPPPTTGGGSSGGGSSGGGSSSGGTPTPSVTYTKFNDLTGNQTFQTSCALAVNLGQSAGASGFGNGLVFNFDDSADTYLISTGRADFDVTFRPEDLQFEDANGFRYERPNGVVTGAQDDLFLAFNPGIELQATEYARFGRFVTIRGDGNREDYRCVFGVPTQLDDTLPSSTISYSQLFTTGTAFRTDSGGGNLTAFNLRPSQITFTADPSNGAIEFRAVLTGTPSGGGSDVQLAEITGSTSIDGSVQSFEGTLADSGNVSIGSFGGWFFGPQGSEMGISWGGAIQNADGSRISFTANTMGSNP